MIILMMVMCVHGGSWWVHWDWDGGWNLMVGTTLSFEKMTVGLLWSVRARKNISILESLQNGKTRKWCVFIPKICFGLLSSTSRLFLQWVSSPQYLWRQAGFSILASLRISPQNENWFVGNASCFFIIFCNQFILLRMQSSLQEIEWESPSAAGCLQS